ncbi:MAG: TIGR04255 family protein [Gemmatimonadetes bacterium]|nr:TIGR04255 family protein [Gemmatimonadota bacterium]
MARVRHLSRAPITEALIDLRAGLPENFSVERLAEVRDSISARYPIVEEQRLFKTTLEFQPSRQASPANSELGLNGYLFKSGDRLTVAQFRRDGFTLNRLKPYTSWGELYPEARTLWGRYADVAGIQDFTRLATRFINHLKVPAAPVPDFERYLTSIPAPPGTPQTRDGFLSRVESRDPTTDLRAIVTQATEPAAEPGMMTIILDIDVYKPGSFRSNDPVLDEIFEALHVMKNAIFFGAITETTAEEYE